MKTVKEIMPPVSEPQFDEGKQGSIEKHEVGVACTKKNWRDWHGEVGINKCPLCYCFIKQASSSDEQCTDDLCPLHDKGNDACCREYSDVCNAYQGNHFSVFHSAEVALLQRIKDLEREDYLKLYWASMKGERFEAEATHYTFSIIGRSSDWVAGHKYTWEITGYGRNPDSGTYLDYSNDERVFGAYGPTGYPHPIVRLVEEKAETKAYRFAVGDKIMWTKRDFEVEITGINSTHRGEQYIARDPEGYARFVYDHDLEPLPETKKTPVDYPPDLIGRDGTPMWFCNYFKDCSGKVVAITASPPHRPIIHDIDLPVAKRIAGKRKSEFPYMTDVANWLESGGYERLPKDKRVVDGVPFEAYYDSDGDLRMSFNGKGMWYLKSTGTIEAGLAICHALNIVPRPCEKGDC